MAREAGVSDVARVRSKELIALANDCTYCKGAHSQMAKMAGANDLELTELREVVELFASYNSIADSLEVPLDQELNEE